MIKLSIKEGAVVVLLFLGACTLFAHRDLEPAGALLLKRWVIADYERYHLDRSDLPLTEKAEMLQQAQTLEFSSVAARGHARNLVVKIELAPNPAHPPQLPTTLYFRMKYSPILGWTQVPQNSSALSWFLALFFL